MNFYARYLHDAAVMNAGELRHFFFPAGKVVWAELVQVIMTAGSSHDFH